MASILKVDTIQDQSGNNIINENADTITIGASGDTITVPTGATLTVPNGGLSGQNYPAFEVYASTDQTIVDVTTTKVVFNAETLDTDSCFDSTTNYRFTPTVAGKYFCYSTITLATTTYPNSSIDEMRVQFYKNGAQIKRVIFDFKASPIRYGTLDIMDIVSFNGSTDYLEVFAFIDSSIGTPMVDGNNSSHRPTYFGAYRIGA